MLEQNPPEMLESWDIKTNEEQTDVMFVAGVCGYILKHAQPWLPYSRAWATNTLPCCVWGTALRNSGTESVEGLGSLGRSEPRSVIGGVNNGTALVSAITRNSIRTTGQAEWRLRGRFRRCVPKFSLIIEHYSGEAQ